MSFSKRFPLQSILITIFFGFGVFVSAFASPLTSRSSSGMQDFAWNELQPSPDLKWTPCYGNFTCARLEVPLDYENPSAGTTAIAFTKLASQNPDAEDILLNPGGPGESGVQLIVASSAKLLSALGTRHNLVGFDIRGVLNSGPNLSCFLGQPANQNLFDLIHFRDFDIQTPRGLASRYAAGKAYGEWCTAALKDGPARYANTPAIARDMLQYAEAVKRAKGEDPRNAKVWLYGMSYGAILGQTFAALYPGRVGRIIVDGVADSVMYYTGMWNTLSYQADEAMRYFFQSCADAGPKLCSFSESSAQAVETRFDNLLVKLAKHPVPVTNRDLFHLPALVNDVDVRSAFLPAVMNPIPNFAKMSDILVALEKGNGTELAMNSPLLLNKISANFTLGAVFEYNRGESMTQISCLDANGRGDLSDLNKFEKYVANLNAQSYYLGDIGGPTLSTGCLQFGLSPPPSQQFNSTLPTANNTSFPLLFVGNTVDPTTPLAFAKAGATRFPGAGLLVQDSVGHISISSPSKCTAKYLQMYLTEGKLPPANTTCLPDVVPFQNSA